MLQWVDDLTPTFMHIVLIGHRKTKEIIMMDGKVLGWSEGSEGGIRVGFD